MKKYKWYCNECGNTWSSDSKFEDLCNYVLCESDHIYYIKKKKKKKEKKKNKG